MNDPFQQGIDKKQTFNRRVFNRLCASMRISPPPRSERAFGSFQLPCDQLNGEDRGVVGSGWGSSDRTIRYEQPLTLHEFNALFQFQDIENFFG